MADPFTCIGAAASVGGIIDMLSRTINLINWVAEQWKDAQLAFLSLQTQLLVLRAALSEIQKWFQSSGAYGVHHQLTMDLDSVLLCCKSLISRIDSHLSGLRRDASGQLGTIAKVKLVLGGRNIGEIQKMVEQQTGALNLLLTACNSNALAEQKKLLEKKSTRTAISRVEKDSASLIVHRDDGSLRSTFTDNLSKISRVFNFDADLLGSKVYDRAWRINIKTSLRAPKVTVTQPTLDRYSKEDVKVLLLGASLSAKSTLLKQLIHILSDPNDDKEFSGPKRESWAPIIFGNICHYVTSWESEDHAYAELAEPGGPLDNLKEYIQEIEYIYDAWDSARNVSDMNTLRQSAFRPFSKIWGSEDVQRLLETHPSNDMANFCYFMENLERILSPDYIPTFQDITKSRLRTTGISETVFNTPGYNYRVFDVGGTRSERKKWIHCFDKVDIILFQVSLGGYDKCLIEDREQNQLVESLDLWHSICNSRWFHETSFFLNFTQADVFAEKVSQGRTTPPKEHFPYDGEPDDVISMRKMITEKFLEADIKFPTRQIPVTYINAIDTEQVRALLEEVNTIATARVNHRTAVAAAKSK